VEDFFGYFTNGEINHFSVLQKLFGPG